MCCKEIQVSTKLRILPCETSVLKSGLIKFRHGTSIVATCCQLSSIKTSVNVTNKTVVGQLSWQYLRRSTVPLCLQDDAVALVRLRQLMLVWLSPTRSAKTAQSNRVKTVIGPTAFSYTWHSDVFAAAVADDEVGLALGQTAGLGIVLGRLTVTIRMWQLHHLHTQRIRSRLHAHGCIPVWSHLTRLCMPSLFFHIHVRNPKFL